MLISATIPTHYSKTDEYNEILTSTPLPPPTHTTYH